VTITVETLDTLPRAEPTGDPAPFGLAGRLRATAANRPIACDDATRAWIVLRGNLDLFAVAHGADGTEGARYPLFSVPEGGLVLGIPPGRAPVVPETTLLVAAGHSDSELFEVDLPSLLGAEPRDRVGTLVDGWIAALSAVLFEPDDPWPIEVAQGAGTLPLAERDTLHGRPGQVLWAGTVSGRLEWLDRADAPVEGPNRLPLVGGLMVRADGNAVVSFETTADLLAAGQLAPPVARLMELAAGRLTELVADRQDRDRERLRQRAEAAASRSAAALEQVADLLRRGKPKGLTGSGGPPILVAFAEVARAIGMGNPAAVPLPATLTPFEAVQALARSSGLNVRRVLLRGEWWRADQGPLVAFRGDGKAPVALLPAKGAYELADPERGTREPVTPALAATLADEAAMLYPSLPEQGHSLLRIMAMGFRGIGPHLVSVLGLSLITALLALVTPLVTATVVDEVIPRAEYHRLAETGFALVLIALGTMAFSAVRALALVRIECSIDGRLQAALFGRLLALPTNFFRSYSVGDLTDRVLGIQRIRMVLTGTTLNTMLQGLFSVASFLVLFHYNWRLALVAGAVVLATAVPVLSIAAAQRTAQAEVVRFQGRLDGLTVQILSAIGKLRVAEAEQRAFARWVEILAGQKERQRRVQGWANRVQTLNAIVPVLAPAALFVAISVLMKTMADDAALAALLPTDPSRPEAGKPMSTGEFLAFMAAFGQFLAAFLGTCLALTDLLEIGPLVERALPIFKTEPEVRRDRSPPGALSGAIDMRHIVFRYHPSGPPVLSDLSLQIGAGEFVAIVGPSGCGKSTLVRLLLGFETPESGNIYFDGRPLDTLDVTAVRSQFGAVLQNGRINPGSIAANIVGASAASLEDAWAAARQVGLAADIEAMPMGMHTVLVEGAQTLSGGQRQRLMLARALVHRPRVLILDEATSALDNRTQAVVTESLAKLRNTRIVIAHRLSTIMEADRIVVIDNGRVAQSGRFDELLNQPGPFAELARRQLT